MATYTSIRSGSTSDTNPATNPWGNAVLPTVGDKVIIATTHIVTIDGTVNWGNDTSTGITINGTLKHSRAVNTKITARGDIFVGATGTYDAGTEADPMPSTVTAEIELNDSATMAANKWGFRTDDTSNTWAGVRLWGATKTRMTDFAVQAGATDTVITVTDATGWKIGDKLVIESTVAQANINGIVYRAITGIAGNVVTLSSSVVAIKPIGTKIMNLSSNVKVYGKSGNTYPSYFSIRHSVNFTTVDAIEIGETEFYCGGTTTDVMKQGVLSLTWQTTTTNTDSVKRIYRPIVHNIWSISGSTVTKVNLGAGQLLNLFGNQAYRYTIEEPILSSENHYCMTWYSGTNTDIRDIKCIRSSGIATTGYSQGPVGTTITGGYMSCISNLVAGTGVIVQMSDMTINGVSNFGNQTAYGIYYQRNIIFGPMGDFTGSNSASFSNGSNAPILMDGCTFQATGSAVFALTRGSTNINNTASGFSYARRNINNDVTLQDKYVYGGKQERDNSIYSNSLSALRLDSWYSSNPNEFVSSVSVGANETRRILGKCRYNTGYGTTYPTTLTVSGLGITPIVYTMPTTGADTWFPIDISVTNPNAYPGTFTLNFSGKSAANTESASVWFSGITIPDFVTVSRHYGFQFLNQPYQIENSFITETVEATVSAYTGITIDHGTNTITLSSNHTIQEVYDYAYYNLTLNANLSEPEYFTTTDGVTFNTTYNIVNNNALTGSGTLITTGTYTGSGTTTLVIKDSVGVRCKITSGGGSYTIKGATIAYEADITEKTIVVTPSTNVSFVMWKLGYKPQIFTINSGLLGGTFDISMTDISEAVDTGLNVAPIIALTSTSVDMSGYHMFFGEMELSLEQIKAVVHRLMKYENYFNAVLATSDDNIVEVRSDEIRVNKPLFTLEREVSLTLADRVQLNGYINISNAVTIDPLYIINPGDSDGLYVTYLTVKPGIDVNYLAQKVWENDVRTITSGGLTLAEIEASTILAKEATIPTVGEIRTELSPELALINLNLDAKVSEAGGGGGGGGFSSQAIQTSISNAKREIIEKIGEIPQVSLEKIETSLNEIDSHNLFAKEEIINTIKEVETEVCSDIIRKTKEIKEDNITTRNLVRQKTKKLDENVSKLADRQDKTDKMIEDEADEIEASLEEIYKQEADMIEKDLEEQYKTEADEIEKSLTT